MGIPTMLPVRRAFTRTELLVVVLILGILLGLLGSAASRVRMAAWRTSDL